MILKRGFAFSGLLFVAHHSSAGTVAGDSLGLALGNSLSAVLGGVLPQALGSALPLGIGGAAGIAALSLIMGVQLIKRKNKK
jgi:predicted MFS family arabinose efflux permease